MRTDSWGGGGVGREAQIVLRPQCLEEAGDLPIKSCRAPQNVSISRYRIDNDIVIVPERENARYHQQVQEAKKRIHQQHSSISAP